MNKQEFLQSPVEHVDFTAFDATPIIDGMRGMSFSSRDVARATDIYSRMLEDKGCTVMLTLAGSTSAARPSGCPVR